jgi:hypothetical protein
MSNITPTTPTITPSGRGPLVVSEFIIPFNYSYIPYKPKRSPSLVGGDWNMFYDVPFSWEWNVIIPTDEVHHFSEG